MGPVGGISAKQVPTVDIVLPCKECTDFRIDQVKGKKGGIFVWPYTVSRAPVVSPRITVLDKNSATVYGGIDLV